MESQEESGGVHGSDWGGGDLQEGLISRSLGDCARESSVGRGLKSEERAIGSFESMASQQRKPERIARPRGGTRVLQLYQTSTAG